MRHTLSKMAALALFMACALPAHAITYVGNRNINGGFGEVIINITTDGTLGVLSAFNITDFQIEFANFITFESASLRRSNSAIDLVGSGLSATPTALTFDFNSVSSFVLTNGTAFCGMNGVVPGPDIAQCNFLAQCELLFFGSGIPFSTVVQFNSGPVVLATAPGGPGAVPEPASWAMMIAGFGLAGGAMRRRARISITYA